jgi:hypothetical protein
MLKYALSLTWIKAAFNNNATAQWRPSWWESATAGHKFGRGPSNDYFIVSGDPDFQSRWPPSQKYKKGGIK